MLRGWTGRNRVTGHRGLARRHARRPTWAALLHAPAALDALESRVLLSDLSPDALGAGESPACSAQTVVSGTPADDVFYLRLNSAGNELQVFTSRPPGPTPAWVFPLPSLTTLRIDALAGNDCIVADFSNGNVVPTGGLDLSGGDGDDVLVITGTSPHHTLAIHAGQVLFGASPIARQDLEAVELGSPAEVLRLSSLTVDAEARLAPFAGVILRTASLTLADGATFDAADNMIIIDAPDPDTARSMAAALSARIASARNTWPLWTGPGLTSSAARADTLAVTGLATITNIAADGDLVCQGLFGQTLSANSVIVKYAYNGDSNLDSIIDACDYFRIDQGFLNGWTTYREGDFDYSGPVDADDYILIDAAFLYRPPDIDVALEGSGDVHGWDFGSAVVGETLARTFSVRNLGHAQLRISNAAGLAGPFSVIPPNGNDPADDWIIRPGESAEFTIVFAPVAPGAFSATLLLVNNDLDEWLYPLAVTGAGLSAQQTLHRVGQWGGGVTAVAVADTVAWVCQGDVLRAVDISFPAGPSPLGSVALGGAGESVVISGTLAYVAAGDAGLRIIDISDPWAPALLGGYPTADHAWGVAVAAGRAYVAVGESGVEIIDVANPASPQMLGVCDTDDHAWAVAVAGTLAYVADGATGLQIIDVGDPANPVLLGSCDTPGAAWGLAVAGTLAYVADGYVGLRIIDISDPNDPAPLGALDTDGEAWGVAVAGTIAYLADGPAGLRIIDVNNPAQPVLLSTHNDAGAAWGVALSGQLACVADHDRGLHIIDTGDPAAPVLVGRYDQAGPVCAAAAAGTLVYAAASVGGIHIIDAADAARPLRIGFYDTTGMACDIAVAGDLAYVADYDAGLQIIDVSNPAMPARIGGYDTPGRAVGVAASGTLVCMADYERGLQVIDVTDPTSPARLGGYDTAGMAMDVAVSGTLAFVADGPGGLRIISIANPSVPALLGTYDTPGMAVSVAVSGALVFVADNETGLLIIDAGNPAAPTLAGLWDEAGGASGVAVSGDLAYVACVWSGFHVLDVADPGSPKSVAFIPVAGYAMGVAAGGGLVHVACADAGLMVLRMGDDHGDRAADATGVSPPAGITASIERADDVDFFRFAASAGQVLSFQVAPAAPGNLTLLLLDADGRTILRASTGGAPRIDWTAPADGTYYLRIGGDGAWTGRYTLQATVSGGKSLFGDVAGHDPLA